MIKRIAIYFDFKHCFSRQINNCDVLLTHQDADCAIDINGKKYPPHIGAVIKELDLNKLSWVVINGPDARFYGDSHYFNASSYNLWLFITRFLSLLTNKFGMRHVSDVIKAYYWKRLLMRINPKVIIGIQPHPGLCIAARTMDIPIYDYQHGVIDEGHWWYCEKAEKQPVNHMPTGFLCWDERSANCLNRWAKKADIQTIIIGNLWLSSFINNTEDEVFLSKEFEFDANDKYNILVTLQPELNEIFYHEHDFWLMPSVLEDIIKETSKEYTWYLRLHPRQMQSDLFVKITKYLEGNFSKYPNVHWDRCSSIPLPILLSSIDAHITDCSTVVIESSYYGVSSAIMNPFLGEGEYLQDLFKKERDNGMATLVFHDKEKIMSWLEESIQKPKLLNSNMKTNFKIILKDIIMKKPGEIY